MNIMSNKIKVTIGITCYNSENTIDRALNCAINQEWSNKEIIVIDDGSTDSSVLKIEQAIKDKDIVFIKNKVNKGTSFSRNQIVKNSNSEFLCFMDDDDYSDPQRIKKQVLKIIESGYPKNKFIACCTGIKKVYKNGYTKNMNPIGTNGRVPIGNELANYLLFYEKKKRVDYGFSIPTCCLMITKNCFNEFGFFDTKLRRVEDMDLIIRLSLGNIIFTAVKEILVTQNADVFSEKISYKNFSSEIELIKKYKNYLDSKRLFEYSLLWPKLRLNYFRFKYLNCFFILLKLLLKNPLRTVPHFLETASKRFIHDIKNNSISFSNFLK